MYYNLHLQLEIKINLIYRVRKYIDSNYYSLGDGKQEAILTDTVV